MSNVKSYQDKAFEEANLRVEQGLCYEVILSTKDRIKCDADELWRVVEGLKTGSLVKLRQGFFNPSFYVAIVLDKVRHTDFKDKVWSTVKSNIQELEYGGSNMKPLPELINNSNIFKGVNLKPLNGQKMLKDNA